MELENIKGEEKKSKGEQFQIDYNNGENFHWKCLKIQILKRGEEKLHVKIQTFQKKNEITCKIQDL